MSSSQSPQTTSSFVFSWRFLVALLLFFNNVISYADRAKMSLAVIHMDHLEKKDQGWVLGSFYIGYMLTLLPAGVLATRWNSKYLLIFAVILWTCFDVCTALLGDILTKSSSVFGIFGLCFLRIGLGAGEGFSLPCQAAIAGQWFPVEERSRLISLYSSGMDFGTIVALLIGPSLSQVPLLGWRTMFYFWGFMSFLWVFGFAVFAADAPENHEKAVKCGEADFIEAKRVSKKKAERFGILKYFQFRQLWGIYLMCFGGNALWFCLLSWLPRYFESAFEGFRLKENPVLLPLVYFSSWLGTLSWGVMADFLIKSRRWRVGKVRKIMNSIGVFSAAFLTLVTVFVAQTPATATLGFALTLFLGRACIAGFWANIVDICPSKAAQIMAVTSVIGGLPGALGQPLTSWLLEDLQAGWEVVFGLPTALSILGGLAFALWGDDRPLDASTHGSMEWALLSSKSEI